MFSFVCVKQTYSLLDFCKSLLLFFLQKEKVFTGDLFVNSSEVEFVFALAEFLLVSFLYQLFVVVNTLEALK